ncbi:MAG: hypothetical protein EXR59_02810 [Dehalococcoidia bacterium]|nr:hypothetical protein [Dehalococcoidia bacterium]
MNQGDLEAHRERFKNAHTALRKQLESFNPDALIIVGGDQSEMFDKSNKANMMIYTGSDAFGLNSGLMFAGMNGEQYLTHYKCDAQLSKWILNELITREGFDIAASDEMRPLGNVMGRPANGLPHAFINPAEIMPRPDLPTILIYENTYDPPAIPTVAPATPTVVPPTVIPPTATPPVPGVPSTGGSASNGSGLP